MTRRKKFFQQSSRPEDEAARQRDVEALLAPRRVVSQDVPVERIRPNPYQARKNFDNIEDMANAIRQLGFTTRLRVRPDPSEPGMFQLVFGERRLLAAKQAELAEVPCDIAEHTDEELIEIGLAENIQRRDLDPLEEAQAFRTLIDHQGYSIRKLAERIGKDKGYVEGRLALLRAPDDVKQMVEQRPDTIRAAWEIAKLDTEEQRQPIIEKVVSGDLTKDDVRKIVRNVRDSESQKAETRNVSRDVPDSKAKDEVSTAMPNARDSGEKIEVSKIIRDVQEGKTQSIPGSRITLEIQRDIRTLRTMFNKWETLLVTEEAEEEAVQEAIAQLIDMVQHLTEAVKEYPGRDFRSRW